ncbi:hypothetical protein [Rhizobium mayense]|uniref:Uncharacterized protein n=1 Tax=Rhizobium mayense TaxID=1312184 RepID=A0ABT7JTE0_9HYPH|nr:hypothetical protein [Rhizobium mayense]MDL2398423.1 hypothetical protein [Rhizobium mayense]
MTEQINETPTSLLFERRKRHFQSKGLRGAALFLALAADLELPGHIDEASAAAILGVLPSTLKARRRKRMPPAYTRPLGYKGPLYDTAVVCDMLAENTAEGRLKKVSA